MKCQRLNQSAKLSNWWHRLWCAECRAAREADAVIARGIAQMQTESVPPDGLARTRAAVGLAKTMNHPRRRILAAAFAPTLPRTLAVACLLVIAFGGGFVLKNRETYAQATEVLRQPAFVHIVGRTIREGQWWREEWIRGKKRIIIFSTRAASGGKMQKEEMWIRSDEYFWTQFLLFDSMSEQRFLFDPRWDRFMAVKERKAGDVAMEGPSRLREDSMAMIKQGVQSLAAIRMVAIVHHPLQFGVPGSPEVEIKDTHVTNGKSVVMVEARGWRGGDVPPGLKEPVIHFLQSALSNAIPVKWLVRVDVQTRRIVGFEEYEGKEMVGLWRFCREEEKVREQKVRAHYQKATFQLVRAWDKIEYDVPIPPEALKSIEQPTTEFLIRRVGE
jgi:hypothetical protein